MATTRQQYKMAIVTGFMSDTMNTKVLNDTAENQGITFSEVFKGYISEIADMLIKEDQEHEEKEKLRLEIIAEKLAEKLEGKLNEN